MMAVRPKRETQTTETIMSKYHASQEYTIHTRKPGRFEGGVISYPVVDSLKELSGPLYNIDNKHHYNNIIFSENRTRKEKMIFY